MSKLDSQLAFDGAKPVRTKAWSDNFTVGKEEQKAVMEVLESGYLSLFEGSHAPDAPFSFWGGPKVQELEQEWCKYYGSKYAVSMNSATSGLYAAIGALGLGYGDEVIVSPYTMTACAAAPLIYGAIPIFADVKSETGSLDPQSVRENLTKRTKAILVIHQFGIPADMDEIMQIAKEHNLYVIEDCAQAHGAKYKDQFVGTIGDIGVFSLNVNKSIQAGEGAVVTTNDDDLRYRLALIRNHGEAVVGPAEYENITNIIGFNYRLTEVQAAIASVQLHKLDQLNDCRLSLVNQLKEGIKEIEFLNFLQSDQDVLSTYYVAPISFDIRLAGQVRDEFIKRVNAEGMAFYQGYVKPLYYQPLYQKKQAFKNGYPWSAPENKDCKTNYKVGSCPVAEDLHFNQLIINEHVRHPHTQEDIDDMIQALVKVADAMSMTKG